MCETKSQSNVRGSWRLVKRIYRDPEDQYKKSLRPIPGLLKMGVKSLLDECMKTCETIFSILEDLYEESVKQKVWERERAMLVIPEDSCKESIR